jgi:Fe-S oxidoreductase
MNSKRVVDACLNCKSCRVVCPAGIDVSEEILRKRAQHPNPLAGVIFWLQDRQFFFETVLGLLGLSQPLWDRPPGRALLDVLTRPVLKLLAPTARIPKELILPRIATKNLRQRYAHLAEEGEVKHHTGPHTKTIAYFHGCAANYLMDGVGDAVIRLLQKLGVDVALPRQKCSGTPIQTYGLSDRVEACARFNVNSLLRYETIVTGCASCTLMLKDYPAILNKRGERDQAVDLASRVMHITEFLAKRTDLNILKRSSPAVRERVVTYHSSCHLRAAGITHEPRELLQSVPGIRFVEMQDADRCAGGAGTFIVKNYDLSYQVFERKRRAIAATGADVVATSCPACMIQLNNGLRGGVKVKHVAELLEEAL